MKLKKKLRIGVLFITAGVILSACAKQTGITTPNTKTQTTDAKANTDTNLDSINKDLDSTSIDTETFN